MKTLTVILAATTLLLFFTACHRSNPSVVGDWTLKTVQGTVVTPTGPEHVTSYIAPTRYFMLLQYPITALTVQPLPTPAS